MSGPFCNICYKAGKAGFKTHWVKDRPGPSGKVVCPTLLATTCNTCGDKGHISRFCRKKQKTPGYDEQYWEDFKENARNSKYLTDHGMSQRKVRPPQTSCIIGGQVQQKPSYANVLVQPKSLRMQTANKNLKFVRQKIDWTMDPDDIHWDDTYWLS